jgi:hypothetical protein
MIAGAQLDSLKNHCSFCASACTDPTTGSVFANPVSVLFRFLPAYSPNLNLIERFWKFVKQQWLSSKDCPDAAAFQHTILSFIAETPTQHQDELAHLLPLKFQTFKDVPLVPEPKPLPTALQLKR